jgi:predicted Rossmann fold nucleotide-binding protein DprA/Smf involved in DNA uptake
MTIPEIIQNCKKIAVIGTRGYNDMGHFSQWIKYYTQNVEKICFVSGGATSGADALIELYASANDNNMLVHYPRYNDHGKRAPLVRNKLIVDSADVLIAFWDGVSTGTAHTIGLAKEKGIPVRIVPVTVN